MVGGDILALQSTWDVQASKTKYSRLDQVKTDRIISKFLKAVFHNFHLFHSSMLFLKYH